MRSCDHQEQNIYALLCDRAMVDIISKLFLYSSYKLARLFFAKARGYAEAIEYNILTHQIPEY